MNNDELRLKAIRLANRAIGDGLQLRGVIEEICERLDAATTEALQAGGVNDGWAVEVDRLTRQLDQSTNYITDREESPHKVWFENGRCVHMVYDDCGNASLDVTFEPAPGPLKEAEKAALASLTPDFLDGIINGVAERNEERVQAQLIDSCEGFARHIDHLKDLFGDPEVAHRKAEKLRKALLDATGKSW
jgi:hypothetical protein